MTADCPADRWAIRTGLTEATCSGCKAVSMDARLDEWFRLSQFGYHDDDDQPSRAVAAFCSIRCLHTYLNEQIFTTRAAN
jgi:hypothetical protein